MKYILALFNTASKGKTATLREFSNLLLTAYPNHIPIIPVPAVVPQNGDFRLVVQINNKIIGVETEGDPGTYLGDRLIHLADNIHCDVILCTTRTSGETVDAVDHLERTRGFQTIWTSTYQIATQQALANQIKGRHILELLQGLGII